MPGLSAADVDAFLAEPGHLVRLATVDAEGWPRVVPLWFVHDDGRILFTPRAASAFLADLRRDGRVAVSIDEEAHPWRKVTVRGRAECLHDLGEDDQWRDLYRRIARRYVSPTAADAYVDATIAEPRALYAVTLAASTVTTWRMPVRGEDPRGVWAERYYVATPRPDR